MSTISDLGTSREYFGSSRLWVKTKSIFSMSSGRSRFLVLALRVFAIGVDEKDLVLECVGLALVADQHAGGDARAVEEAGR